MARRAAAPDAAKPLGDRIEFLKINELRLDPKNPRLPKSVQGKGQEAILKFIVENYEPIIVGRVDQTTVRLLVCSPVGRSGEASVEAPTAGRVLVAQMPVNRSHYKDPGQSSRCASSRPRAMEKPEEGRIGVHLVALVPAQGRHTATAVGFFFETGPAP